MTRFAGGFRFAPVVVPSVVGLCGRAAPVSRSSHVVGGGDHVLAARPVVGRGAKAGQQAGLRIVENARYLLVTRSVEVRPKRQARPGSDNRVVRQAEWIVQGATGEGLGDSVRVDQERGKTRRTVQRAKIEGQAGVSRHRRQPGAVERGADQPAGITGGAGQVRRMRSGGAMPEGIDPNLQQIDHIQLPPRIHRTVVVRLRIRQGYFQFAGQRERERGVIGPARKAVGLWPVGLFRHGYPEV